MDGRLIGNYQLGRELGRGAFGVAYEAWQMFDDKPLARVAIKFITPQDERQRDSIIGELMALANLSDPHVVGYRSYDEVELDGARQIYIVLEFADGGTLTEALRSSEMSAREILCVARDVAKGLAFLAVRGVVHRDIKPDNVLGFARSQGMLWKISDLGLAAPVATESRALGAAGTMLYMAPEAWRGASSPTSDVWALGLCLHEAATQKRLWCDAAPGALEYLICNDAPPLDADLPLVLRPLIEGCLQHDVARRWSAAHALQYAEEALKKLPSGGDEWGDIIVSQSGGGTHSTVCDAIADAAPNSRIAILPGHYVENVVIDKNLHLIGIDPRGGQAREKVFLECGTGNALKVSGAQGRLENISLRGMARAAGKKFHAVTVGEGALGLKNCAVTSDSLACIMAGGKARIALLDSRLEAGASDGVLAQDGAQVVLRDSRIDACLRGITARRSAQIDARATTISNCGEDGVRVTEAATVILDNCKISGNGAGLSVGSGANAKVKGGQISHNKKQGVRAESGSVLEVEGCDLRGNGFGAWQIDAGAQVTRGNNTPA